MTIKTKTNDLKDVINQYGLLITKIFFTTTLAITILGYYLDYLLSEFTKSILNSTDLTNGVWGWIIVKCILCGLLLTTIFTLAIFACFYLLTAILTKCKYLNQTYSVMKNLLDFKLDKKELKFLKKCLQTKQPLEIKWIISKLHAKKYITSNEISELLNIRLLNNIDSDPVGISLVNKLNQKICVSEEIKKELYFFIMRLEDGDNPEEVKKLIHEIITNDKNKLIFRDNLISLVNNDLFYKKIATPFEVTFKYIPWDVGVFYSICCFITVGIIILMLGQPAKNILTYCTYIVVVILAIILIPSKVTSLIKKSISIFILHIFLLGLLGLNISEFSLPIVRKSLESINKFMVFEELTSEEKINDRVSLYVDDGLKNKFEAHLNATIKNCDDSKANDICFKKAKQMHNLNYQIFNFKNIYQLRTIESYTYFIYYKETYHLEFTNKDNYYIEQYHQPTKKPDHSNTKNQTTTSCLIVPSLSARLEITGTHVNFKNSCLYYINQNESQQYCKKPFEMVPCNNG